jgi:hypothetical protein
MPNMPDAVEQAEIDARRKAELLALLKKQAQRIMKAILLDVTDRRGWRQEWDHFDADVRAEIKRKWQTLILAELKKKE